MGLLTPLIREHLSMVSAYASGILLDVGCGTKPYRGLFSQVSRHVGMDRWSLVDQSRANWEERKAAVDVLATADHLPFKASSVDTVLATQVIEHLPDPPVFFEEVARVLKRGGHLICTCPLINQLHEEPYDFYRYTEHAVRYLCERSGMRVLLVTKLGGGWHSVGYLVRHMLLSKADRSRNEFRKRCLKSCASLIYKLLCLIDKRDVQDDVPTNYQFVAER